MQNTISRESKMIRAWCVKSKNGEPQSIWLTLKPVNSVRDDETVVPVEIYEAGEPKAVAMTAANFEENEVGYMKALVALPYRTMLYTSPPTTLALDDGLEAALREDAERYRWLREGNELMVNDPSRLPREWYLGNHLDAAIDAAREKARKS
tara:strand:+ start:1425 stop:1877 length:453 start_codon:yes stop_codon:yes gene_type:complete